MTDASIIIPTFNRENTIIRAINSCLEENRLKFEVIVVDDGSTDNTQQRIIDTYPDWNYHPEQHGFILKKNHKTIHYITQANTGAPSARNNGICHSSGKYIKFLDSDDFLVAGALDTEFNTAEEIGSRALLTGWINLSLDDQGNKISEEVVSAPNLSNGIDDMLDGKGPCASAGFYLRDSINHLKWDEAITKAQDWMWAWTVCLDGTPFSRLDIPSSCYVHYASQDRITQQGNSALRSTQARLAILNKVQILLTANKQLTASRATKLAQYYYKDARVVCEQDPRQWLELHEKITQLDAAFCPTEPQALMRGLIAMIGLKKAVLFLDRLKKTVKPLISRR